MERIWAEPMFKFLKANLRGESPFLEELTKVRVVQARIYVGGDNYVAEGKAL